MGESKIKNLSQINIIRDYGAININVITVIEKTHKVYLPKMYVSFIAQHNGARILSRTFDYADPNSSDGRNADAIAFDRVETIQNTIEAIKSGEDPDWDIKYRFEDGLIPFGDNGGGDMICFDYRNDRTTNNPPIVIWNHDMGLEHRVVFIANNFEEFINMLHEPDDN